MSEIRIMPNSTTVEQILATPKRRGFCPVCGKPSHHHVHQECGRRLEEAHRLRRRKSRA
jgi:predicted amidophosphoribosyltransferase